MLRENDYVPSQEEPFVVKPELNLATDMHLPAGIHAARLEAPEVEVKQCDFMRAPLSCQRHTGI